MQRFRRCCGIPIRRGTSLAFPMTSNKDRAVRCEQEAIGQGHTEKMEPSPAMSEHPSDTAPPISRLTNDHTLRPGHPAERKYLPEPVSRFHGIVEHSLTHLLTSLTHSASQRPSPGSDPLPNRGFGRYLQAYLRRQFVRLRRLHRGQDRLYGRRPS